MAEVKYTGQVRKWSQGTTYIGSLQNLIITVFNNTDNSLLKKEMRIQNDGFIKNKKSI
ncbi:hypothetical protein OA093_00615 [bacterium]|nr:hypothetical protein [bacterium]